MGADDITHTPKPVVQDKPQKENSSYHVQDGSSTSDIEKQSVNVAHGELKRRLKSRHLQMIAIGTLHPSELFRKRVLL